MGRYSGKSCRLLTMLAMTSMFFVVELVFGYSSHSMALVADSFHMLSDVLALGIAFACMRIARRSNTNNNTFGWVRAEVLGALVNAVFLLALCFSIFVEAMKRFFEPEAIIHPVHILIVGLIGLAVNVIGIFMFHGHASLHGHSHARPVPLDLADDDEKPYRLLATEAHSMSVLGDTDSVDFDSNPPKVEPSPANSTLSTAEKPLLGSTWATFFSGAPHEPLDPSVDIKSGKKGHGHSHDAGGQLNMHGVFLHILGDALGSIVVIINAIIAWQVDNDDLKKYLDPALSLFIICIISCTTVPLLKESALILLQTVPNHINASDLKDKLTKLQGVVAVHEFHVWRLAGNKIIATAHITCLNIEQYMLLADRIKKFFHANGIHSTTIQPEFIEGRHSPEAALTIPAVGDGCILECPPGECPPASTCCGPVSDKSTIAKSDLEGATTVSMVKTEVVASRIDAGGDQTVVAARSLEMKISNDGEIE